MSSTSWQTFLTDQGAQWDAQGHSYFHQPYATADAGQSFLVDLSELGGLWVSGPQARQFLQGQVTCDMDQLTPAQSLIGAHCNVKGRVLFNFRAVDFSAGDQQHILLLLPQPMIPLAQQTLGKYIVFSKAELGTTPHYQALGLLGPDAAALAGQLGNTATLITEGAVCSEGSQRLLRVDDQAYLCLTPAAQGPQVWQQLAEAATAAGPQQWQLADIQAGRAPVLTDTSDRFLPQQLNLHHNGGISFKKGCYTGQEVVARMHYRGKLKRHLRRAQGRGTPPNPGDPIFVQETAGNNPTSAGEIAAVAATGADSYQCLLVVTDQAYAQAQGQLYLTPADQGEPLQWLPLASDDLDDT